jgi:hypothetical protein
MPCFSWFTRSDTSSESTVQNFARNGELVFKSNFDSTSLEKIRKQVEAGYQRKRNEFIRAIFESHKDTAKNLILSSSLGQALRALDVHVDEKEIDDLLKSKDLNDDGGLDLQEFSAFVGTPSPIEEWVNNLPLSQIVADALPRQVGRPTKDQLRHLCKTTPRQLEESCEVIKETLLKTLQEELAHLKQAFVKLDSQAAANSNSKFQMITMNAGSITDFHVGLASRIGNKIIFSCCKHYFVK